MAWLPALPVAAFAKEPCIETYPDKDIDGAVLGLVIGELVPRYASKLFQKRG